MDILLNELKNEKFNRIIPCKFALEISEEFRKNPALWYKSIFPKEKAEELKKQTQNNYGLIWHTHCCNCFKNIDKATTEQCFVTEDRISWLCHSCYETLQNL